MTADDLTPGQAADLLQVDASTLRRWAKEFAGHLSPQAQGKRRRYTPADLAVLVRARDLLLAGMAAPEVEAALGSVPAQSPIVPAVATAPLPALAGELQEAREIVRSMLAQLDQLRQDQETNRGELAILRAAHDDQAARIAKMVEKIRADQASERARLAADRTKLAQLIAELDSWRRLPWWRRLFERPPGPTTPPRPSSTKDG
jgi:DNA-binding transcriptional MerR regulator